MPNSTGDAGSGVTPSFATTCAMDGVSGLDKKEILIVPTWAGFECTDGDLQHPPRGDGEPDVDEEQDANKVPDNGHGVISACSQEIGVGNIKTLPRTIT